jgi:hypothetical protein
MGHAVRVRSALYIDFDNIFSTLTAADPQIADTFVRSPDEWSARLATFGLIDEHRWYAVRRCYMNPAGSIKRPDSDERIYFSTYRPFFSGLRRHRLSRTHEAHEECS